MVLVLLLVVTTAPARLTPGAQAASEIGYRDFSYNDANDVQIPTADKPQSKLWFHDGSWWGLLYRPDSGTRIHRLDLPTQTWVDTGTTVDDRPTARADVLWDGARLYVVSGTTVESEWSSPPSSGELNSGSARLSRYSYEPGTRTYIRDEGFPVTVYNGSSESITLAKDSTGQLWVTYTRDGNVWVNRSLASDDVWGEPFVPNVNGTATHYDDISAVVSFSDKDGPKVGLMWSNQNTGHKRFYFSVHRDGNADEVWEQSVAAFGGGSGGCSGGCANDHLNLKHLAADGSGRVFAAVKTAKQKAGLPMVSLAVRDRAGVWSSYVYGTVEYEHTRPVVMIDEEHQKVFMFAVSPEVGGTIYYKQSDINNISFPPGLGTAFMQSSRDTDISNPTSTKQNVNGATGIVLLASANTNARYWHNYLSLADLPPGPPWPPSNLAVSSPDTNPESTLQLSWSDNSSDEDGFKVERKTGDDGFSQVATLGANVTSYTDTGLASGTTYTYRVRAWSSAGDSAYSNEASGTTAQGSTRTFAPVADAYVDGSYPDKNYGTESTIKVDASPVQQSYLKFELTGLSTVNVTSTKLRLYVTNASVKGGSIAKTSDTSWQESTVTYNTRPAIDGPTLSTLGTTTVSTWVEFDVTSAVTGDGTLSLGINTSSSDGAHYSSRESTTHPPQLVITVE